MTATLTANYRKPPVGGTSRHIEAWALSEAALRMQAARDAGDKEALLAAVRLNWRMWTIFQADLLGPESLVPEPIRGNLLSLAAFIDRQTIGLIADPQFDQVNVLININRELSAGLYAEPSGGEAGAAVEEPAKPAGSFNFSV